MPVSARARAPSSRQRICQATWPRKTQKRARTTIRLRYICCRSCRNEDIFLNQVYESTQLSTSFLELFEFDVAFYYSLSMYLLAYNRYFGRVLAPIVK